MFKNYIKTSIRVLLRQRGYTLINILGLSIGLTASILIFLFISHELSYDKFHRHAGNIVRVGVKGEMSGEIINLATSMAPIGLAAKNELPEVSNSTRLRQASGNVLLSYKQKKFYEEKIIYADTGFFQVFSFKLLRGDAKKVLAKPYSMVISESTARKFFGKEDPIGRILLWNNEEEYIITGVVEDCPSNTHLDYHVITSFSTLLKEGFPHLNDWGSIGTYTYLLLNEKAGRYYLESKLLGLVTKYFGDELKEYGIKLIPFVQHLTDIHLHSNLMAEFKANSDITNIYIFSAVALFILIIAGINFMNLSTARAQKRTVEVGIRKVLGANRTMLIYQFLTEAIIISIISLLIAIFITELILPAFNTLSNKNFGINYIDDWKYLIVYLLIALIVGIFSGSYPAFYLSHFIPVDVLKGRRKGIQKSFLRYFLVLGQFIISIILIIATLHVFKQMNYIRTKNLGFNKFNLVAIPLRSDDLRNKASIIKHKIEAIPEVESVTGSEFVIGRGIDGSGYFPEGFDDAYILMNNTVDYGYLNTMHMKLVDGRNFSQEYASDTSKVLINETTAKELGWKNPIGKYIERPAVNDTIFRYEVIGVIHDFHITSLHTRIPKVLLHLNSQSANYLTVRYKSGSAEKILKKLKMVWYDIDPGRPFDYFFVDKAFENQYKSDVRFSKLIIYFTILAIFIACLGLFGLSSYTVSQRTKEIGIRKVMGSSINGIVFLLIKEFAKWVLIANIIAWPIAYFLLDNWLQNFEYRISVSLFSFVLAGLLAFSIAMITIIYQSVKASLSNPVYSLRYE